MTRTVVIGGVGPTLGESLAREFATEGDNVALWARSTTVTADLAERLSADTPGSAIAVQTDVTDTNAVATAVDQVHKAFGPVDVYIHNVHSDTAWTGPLTDDPGDLATYFETTGYGLAVVVDLLLEDLLSTDGTVIHHTADNLRWITRAMAEQLASEGVHVVRTVIDGEIDGPAAPASISAAERADPDALAAEYRRLVEQDRSVWSSDVDFRPWGDDSFRM